jgi:hypothetical protein
MISRDLVLFNKTKRNGWVRHVTRKREMTYTNIILVGKPEGKRCGARGQCRDVTQRKEGEVHLLGNGSANTFTGLHSQHWVIRCLVAVIHCLGVQQTVTTDMRSETLGGDSYTVLPR